MAIASATAVERPKRRWGRRVGIGMGVVMVVGIVVVLLLPMWVSEGQGRAWVLGRMNRGMRVQVAVGEWELGWFRGSELKDVRLTEGDGKEMVKCGAVHSGLTLWGVLWGDFDVGETVVEGLEVRVVKRADGSTSVGDFLVRGDGTANGMRRVLRKLRGAVEAKGARVEVVSEAAGESVVYEDVGVEVAIAAAKGPVHVQVTAASAERGLTVNATVPGFMEWREGRAAVVVGGSDFEIAGTKVPTGLACDWAGMDPGWAGSMGKTVELETLSNHASATMQAGVLTVLVRGEGEAVVEGNVLWRAATKGVPVAVVLPAGNGAYRGEAVLNWSPALGRMLGRVNPVLEDVGSAEGLVRVTLGEMNVSRGDWVNARDGAGEFSGVDVSAGGGVWGVVGADGVGWWEWGCGSACGGDAGAVGGGAFCV